MSMQDCPVMPCGSTSFDHFAHGGLMVMVSVWEPDQEFVLPLLSHFYSSTLTLVWLTGELGIQSPESVLAFHEGWWGVYGKPRTMERHMQSNGLKFHGEVLKGFLQLFPASSLPELWKVLQQDLTWCLDMDYFWSKQIVQKKLWSLCCMYNKAKLSL